MLPVDIGSLSGPHLLEAADHQQDIIWSCLREYAMLLAHVSDYFPVKSSDLLLPAIPGRLLLMPVGH